MSLQENNNISTNQLLVLAKSLQTRVGIGFKLEFESRLMFCSWLGQMTQIMYNFLLDMQTLIQTLTILSSV